MTLDPVQLELLYHKFKAVTEEMGITLARTARSSYVRETHDFATALCTTGGRLFAYPADTGISLGIDQDLRALIAAVPDLAPGDVIVSNHPYLAPGAASHLPDLNLLKPYFHDGALVCFGWSFAHCADVGGGVPSSISPSFDTLFQEGLAVPPMKLVERGEINADLMAILRTNSRTPDIVSGDLQAQLSALLVGERRVAELIRHHGLDVFAAAQTGLVEYARVRALGVQRRLADGTFAFHDYLDDDFRSRIPVRLRCRLDVRDGRVHLDLTGTDPQLAAPYNVPTGGLRHPFLTSKVMHMLLTLDPDLPLNHGIFENITVEAPKGTLMHPDMPAPVGIRHATAIRYNDAVLGCLGRANPTIAPAASGGTVIPAVVSQVDFETGRPRVTVLQSIAGGAGATPRNDGADGRDRSLANINNTPTELGELDVDVRVEYYGIRADSGGAGRHRGGTGVTYALRILRDGVEIMGRGLERFVFQPWGVAGGCAGAPARVLLNAGTSKEVDLGKIDRARPRAGDVLSIMTPGGGGYGHPFDRDVEAVRLDVRRGFVSCEAAATQYGVAIDASDLVVDAARTAALRAGARDTSAVAQFGVARVAWERVFEDEPMTRLAVALLRVPAGIRDQIRRASYEEIVPGVVAGGPAVMVDPNFDAGSARERLLHVIHSLEAKWPA
ncbi:MAG: hydantoinase B/oxoprolinase family protein [Vicinamibacterales bacterium]